MKAKFCIVAMLIIVAIVIHFANAEDSVRVRILSDQEAGSVTGAMCDDLCTQLSTGCIPRPCDGKHRGEDCYLDCDHNYRNWECQWYLYGTGCQTETNRDCGWQEAGSCNEEGDCVNLTQNNCGSVTDCSNT